MTLDVIEVSSWIADQDEDLGARDKMWLVTPFDSQGSHALWKEGRPGGKIAEAGADLWAERIAAEIAPLMGIRAARVDFAVRNEVRGIISWRVGRVLRHGNELLSGLHPEYKGASKGPVAGYDLESIRTVLGPYQGWFSGLSAFDCFAGLLVFDALISNSDRHHENWAIMEDRATLAPSYDHGASLGFNTSHRLQWDAEAFAGRGESRHFPNRPTFVALARSALEMVSPDVGSRWLDGVDGVHNDNVQRVVDSVPATWMSDDARTFVVQLVSENRRRLLS